MFGATSMMCVATKRDFDNSLHTYICMWYVPGTHGSGITYNNIAAMVTKLKLISGEGMILTLSAQDNEDIFKAAQVYYYHSVPGKRPLPVKCPRAYFGCMNGECPLPGKCLG